VKGGGAEEGKVQFIRRRGVKGIFPPEFPAPLEGRGTWIFLGKWREVLSLSGGPYNSK